MKWHRDTWLLIGVIALAAALAQSWLAVRHPLWADEIFSVAISTGHSLEHPASAADPSLGDFVANAGPQERTEWDKYLLPSKEWPQFSRVIRATFLSDTSPPLYYILLSVWIWTFNASDFAVRAFSICAALLCLPLIAAIARRLGGRQIVLPACVLFAASPFTLYYGSEARMYSLLWLMLCASALAGLIARSARHRIPAAFAFIISSAAGFLTHYFFIFPWTAVLCFLILRPGRIRRWEFGLWAAAIALFLLPWYLHLSASLSNWRITQDWLNWRPQGFSRFRSAWEIGTQFFTGSAGAVWGVHRKASWLALAVGGGVLLAALWRYRSRTLSRGRLLVVLWFVAGCLGPFVFDLARGTYTMAVPRYAAGALPAAYLVTAIALGAVNRLQRFMAVAFILAAWAPSLRSIYQLNNRAGFNVSDVVTAIGTEPTSRDIILVHSIPSGMLGVTRYYQGTAPVACWVGQLKERIVPASIQDLIAGRERIFFVRIHAVAEPSPEETWLRANTILEREHHWGPNAVVVFRSTQSSKNDERHAEL